MEGRKTSVVGDGYRVALDDLEDEGSGEYSLSVEEEEESYAIEQVSENSNLRPLFSSELTEDTASSSFSSSFSGALFEFSDLVANLPIKRGLSRYYDGKSQSFTCLGRARSLEDLIKKDYHRPYNKRMKSCKSYTATFGLVDPRHHRAGRSYSPRTMISKKGSRNYNSLFPSTMSIRVAASSSGTIGAIINLGSTAKD